MSCDIEHGWRCLKCNEEVLVSEMAYHSCCSVMPILSPEEWEGPPTMLVDIRTMESVIFNPATRREPAPYQRIAGQIQTLAKRG